MSQTPTKEVNVRVPGKVMLAGEYAVLRGGCAVSATLNAFLDVHLEVTAKDPEAFKVTSGLWKESVDVKPDVNADFANDPLLSTVQKCMKKYELRSGEVAIESQLDTSYGIGSSSALRLGVVLGFDALKNPVTEGGVAKANRWDLVREGYLQQKELQGFASGYDIAAQNLGGLVMMYPASEESQWPGSLTRITSLTDTLNSYVHPYVGGKGAPTKLQAKATMDWLGEGERWSQLETLSSTLVATLMEYLLDPADPKKREPYFKAVGQHRRFFAQSYLSPKNLINHLNLVNGLDETWTYKTTGAGGEDAILLFGEDKILEPARAVLKNMGWFPLPFSFNNQPATIATGVRADH